VSAGGHVDVAIIGSGMSGLAMAVNLLEDGRRSFALLERADDLGGTWRDNSYPGCACDVPSHLYSLSFAPNPDWSSTFSGRQEIQAYLRRVADERGVTPFIRFGHEVLSARWDGERWEIDTASGALTARVLIAASGPLSEPLVPDIPGLDGFGGKLFHSARWDHDHDLTGERVAVIGTGASAIQFVPQIQPHVGRLDLYQRTAPWVLRRGARPVTGVERALYRRLPGAQRAMREAIYWNRELLCALLLNTSLSPVLKAVSKAHMRRQVRDPELRAKLTPSYAPGCKRLLISDDYLPSLAQPNVDVITDGIAEVRPGSVVARDGVEREVDTIILGTGFHVTEHPIAERISNAAGSLASFWDGSQRAYRGTAVPGFPNLFFLLGPNCNTGHTSVVFVAEVQARYVMDALRAAGSGAISVRREAWEHWNDVVQRRMAGTVWNDGGCASYYIDRNGLNTSLLPDFTFRFRRLLGRWDPHAWELSA
jgi:cation diffusion facilitator CzcD-associated flavoprotein CzcO